MHRIPRLLVSLVSLSTLASLGCAEDQELMVVRGAVGLDSNCALDDASFLANDTVDVASGSAFALGLVVANLQTQNGNSNTNLEDDGEIKLDYAEVRLSLSSGATPAGLDTSFEVPLPSDSIPSGEESTVLITIPSAVTQALQGSVAPGDLPTLEVAVVLVGNRTSPAIPGGKLGEVRASEYTFPFTLCNGCLICMTSCGLPQSSNCTEDAP